MSDSLFVSSLSWSLWMGTTGSAAGARRRDRRTGMDEIEGTAGRGWRRRLRAPGGRASRLELYAVAAIVLVLGFGSVGGAIVITSNDSRPEKAQETTATVVEETTTTTSAPVVTAPPTTEAPPPPTTQRRNPATDEYVETFAPPVTLPPPGPSGRTCTVPDVVTAVGTPSDPASAVIKLSAAVRASGCKFPTEVDCIDPAVPAGSFREAAQNPAPGTVIDSNAVWYHTVHWSPEFAATMNQTHPPC
ncbi:MAG: hypothetical protein FGM58_09090 [Acidimicrobiia bacterium]|nr:hypothetical protein [Acidimicrobiia bacterium]